MSGQQAWDPKDDAQSVVVEFGDDAGRPAAPVDGWLFAFAMILVFFGLIMVFSASSVFASKSGDAALYLKKQGSFMLVGLLCVFILTKMPTELIYKLTYFLLALFIGLVALTVLFKLMGLNIGRVKGAYRWIPLKVVMLQPMEFLKVALVLYLAYFYSSKKSMLKSISRGSLPPILVCCFCAALLLLQPDFGGCVSVLALMFFMWFVAGGNLRHLIVLIPLFGCLGLFFLRSSAYRWQRVMVFTDPFSDATGRGYQAVQSLMAFGSGKIFGVGLGASRQKDSYLPEGHTDFIMSIVGEELGFVGVSLVILLFFCLFYRCIRLIFSLAEARDRYTAMGLTFILALSVLFNLGVVTSSIPAKGVAMPFLSYGGSSLVSSMICIGILLNLSKRRTM